jgi:hypothetical protein
MCFRATLIVALLAGLGTVAAQERPPASESETAPVPAPSKGNWFTRLFPFGRKTEEKKQSPETESQPNIAESAASVRARERAAWNRRVAVILELRKIALSTHDEQLERKADELDRLAWQTYEMRTAHLPAGDAAFASDEQTLDQHLSQRAADGRSPSPAASTRSAGVGGVAARRD